MQKRGTDASGIALVNDNGEMFVLKDDRPAYSFVSGQAYKDFIAAHLGPQTVSVIVHTRAATTGDPAQNKNNHPLHSGKSAVIHNGMIGNHDYVFKELKLERTADTDSDIIRAIIDAEGFSKKTIRLLDKCSGGMAVAALRPDDPQRMLLVRSGNPLVVAKVRDILVFASEKAMIHKAMRPWVDWKGIEFQQQRFDIAFQNMRDNTAWLLGPNGVEWHDEVKTCYNYVEPNRIVWGKHKKRKDRWANATGPGSGRSSDPKGVAEEREVVDNKLFRLRCPKCQQFNRFDVSDIKTPLVELGCGQCRAPMATAV